MKESIDFMEQNLTEELEIEAIAGKAALSPFYFQRIYLKDTLLFLLRKCFHLWHFCIW